MAAEKTLATTAWSYPYVEYMAQWERQVERRQLFLRSYHFSRDAEVSPRARTRRVVWATPAPRRRQGAPTSPRAHPPLLRLGRSGAPPTLHPTPGRRPRVPLRPPPPEGAAGRERRVRLLLVTTSQVASGGVDS
ncbi:hypothetical protein CFC21_080646 [Triticum aestivum]|uniref:Uncharacterized protein n=2 Tax=Triticum aestivum TaxID=4565 RepID=A0A9R1I2E7_WHEAT|nr:hypothetical protein CFC21_080646 [Triticum aestivum]